MKKVNIFDEKFIVRKVEDLVGEEVFVAAKVSDFANYVNANNRDQVAVCKGYCADKDMYVIESKGHRGYAMNIYYDPDYEAKWSYYQIIPKKIKEAVESIKQNYPYYAIVVQSYEIEPCQNCNKFTITFTGKGNQFTYNTIRFSKSSSEDTATIIIRDIIRVLLKACTPNTFDQKGLYNLAIDLELSQIVSETLAGFQVTPELFGFPNNLSAEEYYELLKERFGQKKEVDMANKKDVELFNSKFVHFMGEQEMIGKKGFSDDSIWVLRTDVENNRCPCECIDVSNSKDTNYLFKIKTDENIIHNFAFFYYDPHYDIKWAYFKENKKVQVKVDERWNKWLDIPDNHDPEWFDDNVSEFRIKPQEKPAQVDIKAENMEVTININGKDIKFKSVEEARLFLNTDK